MKSTKSSVAQPRSSFGFNPGYQPPPFMGVAKAMKTMKKKVKHRKHRKKKASSGNGKSITVVIKR